MCVYTVSVQFCVCVACVGVYTHVQVQVCECVWHVWVCVHRHVCRIVFVARVGVYTCM